MIRRNGKVFAIDQEEGDTGPSYKRSDVSVEAMNRKLNAWLQKNESWNTARELKAAKAKREQKKLE